MFRVCKCPHVALLSLQLGYSTVPEWICKAAGGNVWEIRIVSLPSCVYWTEMPLLRFQAFCTDLSWIHGILGPTVADSEDATWCNMEHWKCKKVFVHVIFASVLSNPPRPTHLNTSNWRRKIKCSKFAWKEPTSAFFDEKNTRVREKFMWHESSRRIGKYFGAWPPTITISWWAAGKPCQDHRMQLISANAVAIICTKWELSHLLSTSLYISMYLHLYPILLRMDWIHPAIIFPKKNPPHFSSSCCQGPSYGLDSLRRLEVFGQFPAAALAVGKPSKVWPWGKNPQRYLPC